MKQKIFSLLFLTSILLPFSSLFAWNLSPLSWDLSPLLHGHEFSYGSIIYHNERHRAGGSWQDSNLRGVRFSYQRHQKWSLYWGVEGYYAKGKAEGKTATGGRLNSTLIDSEVEGRFGYTLHLHCRACISVTPYVGFGVYDGYNNFHPLNRTAITFHNHFSFSSAGGLLELYISPCLKVGCSYTSRWMFNGTNTIQDDPTRDNIELMMNNARHEYYQFPITFRRQCSKSAYVLTPFYQKRHYGGRENFPFNYIDTKFDIYGLFLGVTHYF
jgi:hypothetical protein